jgi:hypothetical protein
MPLPQPGTHVPVVILILWLLVKIDVFMWQSMLWLLSKGH